MQHDPNGIEQGIENEELLGNRLITEYGFKRNITGKGLGKGYKTVV